MLELFEMPGYLGISALACLTGIDLYLHGRKSKRERQAQEYLKMAKMEVLETAQLALNNPYPMLQVTAKGKVIFLNPAAFEKFPRIRELALQHPVLEDLQSYFESRISSVRKITYQKFVYHQTIVPTQVNGEDAFIIYCFDITTRKIFEKNLKASRIIAEKARTDAERANKARGDFLANMSHELRTPMNGIIGLLEILKEADLKGDHLEMVEAVNSSARNLLALLNEILDFSKIEAGELTLETIPFDLRAVVRQVEALQRPVATKKGLAMRMLVDEKIPSCAMGDPSRLQQVLNNLINNALKFTEKGTIAISVDGIEDGKGRFIARIAVADTGIGIPKDKQEKIFEKFQQADESTTRKYGGTGLGLAITRQLVQLMGGRIAVRSVEGQGTVFTFTMPCAIADRNMAIDRLQTDGGQGVFADKNTRILVVDDHPVNLLFMRKTLARLGIEDIDDAQSGHAAVEKARHNAYDVILMDCKMPEMDGYEATRLIRKVAGETSRPVIIAVTADAMKSAVEKCRQAGMDDYISKPVERSRLQDVLQRWIGRDGTQAAQQFAENEAAAPELTDHPEIFDWEHLDEFTEGDKEAERQLIGMFLENLNVDLAKLKRSYMAENFAEWEATAHKLHGASAHMGAAMLAEICDRAQSVPPEDRARMKDVHRLIIEQSAHLKGFLEKGRQAA